MKKRVFTFILVLGGLIVNNDLIAQGKIDSIFLVKIGMSKFQSLNTLNLNKNVYDINNMSGSWDFPDGLQGDSVFVSYIRFKLKQNIYIKSSKNFVWLGFADNNLYNMSINIWFNTNDFDKCLENYKQILSLFELEFPVREKFVSYKDTITKEQNGEGFLLYKNDNVNNYEKLSVGYFIEYEIKWDNNSNKFIKTSNIKDYLFKITYIKCKDINLIGSYLD